MDEPRRALITGITGQDGGHLAELLHGKGYEVFGLIRGQRNARKEMFAYEFPYVRLIEADLTDPTSLIQAVDQSRPHEIYNLGAISHVGYSFRNPQLTADITAKGVLNLLEAVRITGMRGARRASTRRRRRRCSAASTTTGPARATTRTRCSTRAARTASPSSTGTGSPRTTARATACSSPPASCSTTRASGAASSSSPARSPTPSPDPPRPRTTTSRSATCGRSATGATPATTCAGCGRCSSTTSPTTSCWPRARPTRSRSS